MTLLSFCIFLLLPATNVAAPDSTFELFKSFQGEWKISSETEVLPFKMDYEIGSKGSIVTEQFGKELSVFYLEDGNLMMTHYCNVGNQPHLKLKVNNRKDELEFDAVDVANLKAHPAHVQRAIYRIVTPRRMELELVWIRSGSEASEKYILEK